MNKEDLIELKRKIMRFSSEEQIKRDQYLKNLAIGKIQGPQTGYSFVDKPQMPFYRETPIRNISMYTNIYDMIFKDRDLNQVVIGYLDGKCKWTLGKLKKATDKFIDGFKKEGISVGDNVLCGVMNTPEFVAAFIALVTMGAVIKFYDIRASKEDIIEYANSSSCKYSIALAGYVAPQIAEVQDKTTIEKMFVMNPKNSLSTIEKLNILKEKVNNNELKLEEFKKDLLINNKTVKSLTKVRKNGFEYKAKGVKTDALRPVLKVQSSGTTGKSKTIVHSEESMVEYAKATAHADVSMGYNKRILVALPPWIAYGINGAIITPLILGSVINLCADFNQDAIYRNIGTFDTVAAAPFHYRYLRENFDTLSNEKKEEMKKTESLAAGGDKYTAKENEEDEELFGTIVVSGYGDNEDCGGISINPLKHNKYGSVGIPKFGETVIICDKNKIDLQYNQIGDIYVLSKTMFMEYENNSEATKKTIQVLADGNRYLYTGDYGYIDEEGYLYILGRNERVITRQGFKLSAYTIEDAICNVDGVKECITVEIPDKDEEHVPMSFVVAEENLKISNDDLRKIIFESLEKRLKSNEIPKHIMIVDSLKYTPNNKYDFRYYEQLGAEISGFST